MQTINWTVIFEVVPGMLTFPTASIRFSRGHTPAPAASGEDDSRGENWGYRGFAFYVSKNQTCRKLNYDSYYSTCRKWPGH